MPRGAGRRPKTRSFTIFLLKEDCPDQPLRETVTAASEHQVRFENGEMGILYIQHVPGRPPGWLSFFGSSLFPSGERILNSNTAALLVMSRQRRRFAIAFGFGRHLLAPGCWEEDFGLRTTLNSVDRRRLRSVDRMSLDAIGQHSQIQASREADISEFGLDLEQDFLRAVTGRPVDTTLGSRLTGKDSLQVTISINLDDLPNLLDRFLQQWRKEDYKDTFPWVDQIQELRNPTKKKELDEVLVRKIREGDLTRLWLTVPQIIDWSTIEGFKYKWADEAPKHADVHLETFREQFDHIERLTIHDLRDNYIIAVSHDDDHEVESWRVYRCIYCEVDQGPNTYLLTNGHWYKVGTPFLRRINDAFEAIPRATISLPDYTDASEEDYNQRVAREAPGTYAVMDLHPIHMGGHDKVEFCDLFEISKKMVHVKRYLGSSAPLSHLCAQTIVSATLFKHEPEFRRRVNEELPPAFRPVTASPNSQEYEVVLGIVSMSRRQLMLPLFSRINIKNACTRLNDLGYKASLLKIQAHDHAATRSAA